MAMYRSTPGFKERAFKLCVLLSPDGTLISASAAPHCGGTLEGGRYSGQQRKCCMDNIKEWTSLPMPELLTMASRKRWKRIYAESSVVSLRQPDWSRDWTELCSFSLHVHIQLIKLLRYINRCQDPVSGHWLQKLTLPSNPSEWAALTQLIHPLLEDDYLEQQWGFFFSFFLFFFFFRCM